MKVLLVLLLLTILVIVTLPYGLQKQVDELDKKRKLETFYNASAESSSAPSCPSQIDELKAEHRKQIDKMADDRLKINDDFAQASSTIRINETKCMNDKQNLQTTIDTKSTESINYQKNYSDCSTNLSNLQANFDTYTKNYGTLSGQITELQKALDNKNTIINVAQESVLQCDNQKLVYSENVNKLQKQYNELVTQYDILDKAYKELSDNYYIKCYDYYINTRTSVPYIGSGKSGPSQRGTA